MGSQAIDYDALAKRFGAVASEPPRVLVSAKVTSGGQPISEVTPGAPGSNPTEFIQTDQTDQTVDYDALAKQFGATSSEPANQNLLKQFGVATVDQLIGMAKGAGSTAYGVANMIRKAIPGLAWAGSKLSDYTLGHHLSEAELDRGRELLGLTPTNLAQKVGFGAEQFGEFFIPGATINRATKIAEAGTRFAAAFPKLAKAAPMVEYTARGILEAAPAVAIARLYC